MHTVLGRDLETCALSAILKGLVAPSVVQEKELSREGRYLWLAVKELSKKHKPPFPPKSIYTYATMVLGADRDVLNPFMGQVVKAGSGIEAAALVEMVRAKTALVAAVNLASEQLAEGQPDIAMLVAKLRTYVPNAELTSVSNMADHVLPALYPLESFPTLTKATGGFGGLWTVAGDTGVGKSAFAMQVALDMCKHMPTLYYDLELGAGTVVNRLKQALGDDFKTRKKELDKLYLRESIVTLEGDIIKVPAPACIVIDPLQLLPTRTEFRRTSLDGWINKMIGYKRLGYHILLISEKGRAEYGKARLSGFKDTGEIEYRSDVGAHLLGDLSADESKEYAGPIDFVIVKNRHRPRRGDICGLERVRGWRFKEVR